MESDKDEEMIEAQINKRELQMESDREGEMIEAQIYKRGNDVPILISIFGRNSLAKKSIAEEVEETKNDFSGSMSVAQEVCGNSNTPVPSLNVDVLFEIFRLLPQSEIFKMQFVNMTWEDAANQNLLWKDFVFEVKHSMTEEEVLFMIKHLPALQTIKSNFNIKFTDSIVEKMSQHVRSIQNINIFGGLSASSVATLVETYKDLRSISLYFHAEDIVESLTFLNRCCPNLNELILTGRNPDQEVKERNEAAMKLIATGFPNLHHLDIRGCISWYVRFDDSFLVQILQRKGKQLQSLKLRYAYQMNPGVLQAINNCNNLEHLLLETENHKLNFALPNVVNLKSLILDFSRIDRSTLYAILNKGIKVFELPNLKHLRVCSLREFTTSNRFLNKLIDSAPGLEHLELFNIGVEDLSFDLQNIGCLTGLKTLCIRNCFKASDRDIKNIACCRDLATLKIGSSEKLTKVSVDILAGCSKLQNIVFRDCTFSEDLIVYMIKVLVSVRSLCFSFKDTYGVNVKHILEVSSKLRPDLRLTIIC